MLDFKDGQPIENTGKPKLEKVSGEKLKSTHLLVSPHLDDNISIQIENLKEIAEVHSTRYRIARSEIGAVGMMHELNDWQEAELYRTPIENYKSLDYLFKSMDTTQEVKEIEKFL